MKLSPPSHSTEYKEREREEKEGGDESVLAFAYYWPPVLCKMTKKIIV
jgi:hypothetical protein